MKHAILLSMFLFACGGGGGGPTGDDDVNADSGIDSPPIPEGYERLIGRTWSLQPGEQDTYRCVRFTVPEDMYITSIQAQAPTGTHHTVLTFAGANGTSGPDGEQNCSVGTLGRIMIFASGVGTDPLDFPTDVGIKIAAGTQIHLNLHLFNASDNPISGDSAILIKRATTPPPMLAEMVFAGGLGFTVAPGSAASPKETVFTSGCTSQKTYNIFAVWPHQHQKGSHNKIVITHNGTPTTLHDDSYDFNEQHYYLTVPEYSVVPGDSVQVTCTWLNDENRTIKFGESSTDEMCFGGLYRYPAQNEGIAKCTDTMGFGF